MNLRDGLAILMEKYPDASCRITAGVHNFHPDGVLLEFSAYVDTGPAGTVGPASGTIAGAVEGVILRVESGGRAAPDDVDVDNDGAEVAAADEKAKEWLRG